MSAALVPPRRGLADFCLSTGKWLTTFKIGGPRLPHCRQDLVYRHERGASVWGGSALVTPGTSCAGASSEPTAGCSRRCDLEPWCGHFTSTAPGKSPKLMAASSPRSDQQTQQSSTLRPGQQPTTPCIFGLYIYLFIFDIGVLFFCVRVPSGNCLEIQIVFCCCSSLAV